MMNLSSVAIVLATYKPNIDFLIQQLMSLNDQDYPNLKLYVLDDSDESTQRELILGLLNKYITNFKFDFSYNIKNIGSSKTFEKLTSSVIEDYIAYCDQDDIWKSDKISILIHEVNKNNYKLIYSDLEVIDSNNRLIADSFKRINHRVKHVYGDNCFRYLTFRNSVTGCTLLMETNLAKEAIPFAHEYYVHDHWLVLYASSITRIGYCSKRLVKYRLHKSNQIGAKRLDNIQDKKSYYNNKILKQYKQMEFIAKKFTFRIEDNEYNLSYINTRKEMFENSNLNNFIKMFSLFRDDPLLISLEIILVLSKGIIIDIIKKI